MTRCAHPWLLVMLVAWALIAAAVPWSARAQDDDVLGDIAGDDSEDLMEESTQSDVEDDSVAPLDAADDEDESRDGGEANDEAPQGRVDDAGTHPQARANVANPWALRLSAEMGFGMREFGLPEDNVVNRTETGMFPAAGAGFELDHELSDALVLGLLLRYQTSLGLGLIEEHTDGSEHPIDARTHHIEIALAPTLHFDDAARWGLCLSLGYGIAGFRPIAHLVTPGFSLAGPHLRAQLQAPLVPDRLRLRIGPEGQWVAHVGQELKDRGVDSSGFAVGGEAALELSLGEHWMVHAAYREMRSFIGTSQSESFEDVARFVTARVSGKL